MPQKTNLGGVFMTDVDGGLGGGALVSTENVCGLIFDTKVVGGMDAALNVELAKSSFADGNVVELNGMSDMKDVGIVEELMYGLPYYHIRNFFALAGNNKRLFVSFMDSKTDTGYASIERMQLAANGIIYQIGLWTGEAIAKVQEDKYIVEDGGLLSKLQLQAETLGGKVGITNYEGNSPVNILLNAPVVNASSVDYKKLPDLVTFGFEKVSVLIGQPASDAVHEMQYNINHSVEESTSYATVGNIGAALACLSIAPADVSIANVGKFNLVSVMTTAELGFGDLVDDGEAGKYSDKSSFTNIKTLGYTKRNSFLHQHGYIFLTDMEGIENGVFFSSDQTLSAGDYRLLSRCRVMHKARRSVRLALLPYVNQDWEVDTSTGYMSSADIATIQNTVYDALDTNMRQPGSTLPQISGREVTIDAEQSILLNDQLLISFGIVPKGLTAAIFVTEGFAATASN